MNGFIQVGDDDASTKTTCIVEIADGVPGNVTLKNTSGKRKDGTNGYANSFFRVRQGSELIIQGKSDSQRIILDGGDTSTDNISTEDEIVGSSGTLTLNYVTFQNNENLSDRWAPAIKLNPAWAADQKLGKTTITNCKFTGIRSKKAPVLFTDCPGTTLPDKNSYNTPETNAILIQHTIIENCSVIEGDGRDKTDAGQKWGGILRFRGAWVGNLILDDVIMRNNKAEDCSCAGVFWNAFGDKGAKMPTMYIRGCKFYGNYTKYSGGALRIETNCLFEAPQTEIYNNTADVMGGGIHLYGYAGGTEEDQTKPAYNHYYLNENLYVHDNKAQYGGGLAFQLTSACTMFEGSTFNAHFNGAKFDYNKATVKGAALYFEDISGKTKADGTNKYDVNLYINRGSINGNIVAPDPINFEFGKTVAKGSAFYDTADTEDEYKSCGGAVYLNKANIKYESSEAGEMTMNTNKASVYGGAVFVTGKLASLNLQSLSASSNEAQRGAAIACISIAEAETTPRPNPETYATRVTLGDATLSGNTATQDGAGAYLVRGKLTVENNAVFSGNKAGHGGAIHTKEKSILTIGKATFENNEASENGGAIYVEDGCNINITSDAVFRGNKMTRTDNGGGGAICAKNNRWTNKENFDFVTANIKNAVFENNYSGYRGGAIELDGLDQSGNVDFTLENATFTGNEAKIGGAILVNEAKLTYKGGLIYGNRAVITPGSSLPKTSYGYFPYNWNANCFHDGNFSGFGGGIAISKDGQFIIEKTYPFGIYGNTAEIAGNDISTICSDKHQYPGGSNMDNSTYDYIYFPSTLTIPQPEELNLEGFKIPLPKSAVKWMEDYNAEDGAYSLGTNRQSSSHKRYGELLNDSEGIKKLSGLIVDGTKMNSTKYLHLTLGYNFIFVKLVKKGLKAGDTSIFNISYKDGSNYVKYMTVSLTNTSVTDGAETSRIIALSAGDWKIEETDWAWDYDRPAAQEFTLNVNPDATTMRTFTFTNSPKDKPAPNGEGYKINNGMSK
ncbi:MAG: hypothetical protein ACI30S_07275 [Muribaculaceae bacterium]